MKLTCSSRCMFWQRLAVSGLTLILVQRVNGLTPALNNDRFQRTKLHFAPTTLSTSDSNQQQHLHQLPWSGAAVRSSLFRKKSKMHQRRSSTARNMVLTTPEAIIEKASTQKLLDYLIDESVRTTSRKPIMMQFDPSSRKIWRRWKGTIFSETWRSCVRNMGIALLIYALSGIMGARFKESLQGFQILWGQLLSVTTFTLTFFLNQSYALWRKCYELSRRLQGRLNDLGMTLAAHAARKTPASPSEPATYTAGSRQLLELMARYIRLFNLLTYASFTRSHRPILTPSGMRRLVERGLLTPSEREALVGADVPATQRHNAVIIWVIRCFLEGRTAGHFTGGAGFEQQFLEKVHVIRAQYGGIGDELQGRMPLAYAHIVQVLVDAILWMYPVMAYSNGMNPVLGILGTGFLTMSYQGLFDLAKQFLDPYDNENYGKGDDPLCVDTLVAETNAGSVRWMNGFNLMPFSAQRIKDGELFDYLLPNKGYSVEELDQMEEERIKKEREQQEKREREEREREEAERARIVEAKKVQKINEIMNFTSRTATNAASNSSLFSNFSMATTIDSVPQNITVSSSSIAQGEPNASQGYLMDIASETEKDDELDKSKISNHRLVSLEDGNPVVHAKEAVKENEAILSYVPRADTDSEDVTVAANQTRDDKQTESTMTADLAGATLAAAASLSAAYQAQEVRSPVKRKAETTEEGPTEVNGVYPDMMLNPNFNFFDIGGAQWFDEVGDDGQEYRLSQMMAEEEWAEELAYKEEQKKLEPPMSFEEYKENVAELMESAAAELQETRELLGSSSSADVQPSRRQKRTELKYDQTRLDGISQLLGLPPNDLSELAVIEEPRQITGEENSFDAIMQLWGKPPAQISETEGSLIGNNFRGLSDLWDQNGSGEFSSLPWMNEVDSDGKEFRLSEMLANEEWEVPESQVVEAPLSLEDYSKRVNEAFENVKKERKETEAILNASPGANAIYELEEDELGDDPEGRQPESPAESDEATDASSEIRAEVQAALEAAVEERGKIEQQLELRSKIEEDSLAILLGDYDLESPDENVVGNGEHDITAVDPIDNVEALDDSQHVDDVLSLPLDNNSSSSFEATGDGDESKLTT